MFVTRLGAALRTRLQRAKTLVIETNLDRGVLNGPGFFEAPMTTLFHVGSPGLKRLKIAQLTIRFSSYRLGCLHPCFRKDVTGLSGLTPARPRYVSADPRPSTAWEDRR